MIRKVEDLYGFEQKDLLACAVKNGESRGRRIPEEPHPFRTDFQRDRDRILHSRAFRRLEYKTQVFLNDAGDHYRTRLTHTIEVAAVARTIARSLHLNEDLTETIALAHDLGHTPFGHAGERALNRIMAPFGGFDHNRQALKIVDELEIKYGAYDGLNLTWDVRAGLLKHRKDDAGNPVTLDGEELDPFPSLEAQVADVADDLTYYGHDVEDGLESGLLDPDMLSGTAMWQTACKQAAQNGFTGTGERFNAYTVRCLIDLMVRNVILTSSRNLEETAFTSVSEVCTHDKALISFSPEYKVMTDELRGFLFHNLYFNPGLGKLNEISYKKMRRLFQYYASNPLEMGLTARQRIMKVGLEHAAADYIAGMTDRFAAREYERVMGNSSRKVEDDL